MERSIYCRHCGKMKNQDRSGVMAAMRGRRMIIATTTEYDTDEDTEVASRVTRSIFDNYMRRPSVEDRAIHTIAVMANNDLTMMRSDDGESLLCDAAFIFVDQDRARFLISGKSAAYHFENGKLLHRSDPEEADIIGSGVQYAPRLEESFELRPEKNAFLAASRTLAETVSDEEVEALLNASETPEEWMEKLRERVGEDKEFCAVTAFLPVEKPGIMHRLLKN